MNSKVTILDFGMCNLLNIARAFEHIGCDVEVSDNPKNAAEAERLVVPGVGAFKHCIDGLKGHKLDQGIRAFLKSDRPFLGVCVGMQMLFESSDEFGHCEGLGILAGTVKKIPEKDSQGITQGVPHIGWNTLVQPRTGRSWKNTLLNDFVNNNPSLYFVHSFSVIPEDDSIRLADCIYGGHRLCAAIEKDNLMATQFHPERSGPLGLKMLKRFISL